MVRELLPLLTPAMCVCLFTLGHRAMVLPFYRDAAMAVLGTKNFPSARKALEKWLQDFDAGEFRLGLVVVDASRGTMRRIEIYSLDMAGAKLKPCPACSHWTLSWQFFELHLLLFPEEDKSLSRHLEVFFSGCSVDPVVDRLTFAIV